MSSLQKESWEDENGTLSQEQIDILEHNFKLCKQPDNATLMLFAAEAGLSEEVTMKWFKCRLSKWRRSEGLPSECGSVMD
ncbi:homeodomain-only protein [Hyperolius riggenbachi]|uniref:homeodomain-only protein n=1 Tax=Hyperolius riggenbachi TaxID=752182 RepID=UPI0035A3A87F